MKKLLLILLCLPLMTLAQQTYVPDDNFEAYLEANQMGNGVPNDDSVTTVNINTVTILNVSGKSIADLTGIEAFTALTELYCYNNQLTSLDVSSNTDLTILDCYNNQLTSLDVSSNTALTQLYCFINQLTSLDVSSNTVLTELDCNINQLTSLNVSSNTDLTRLYCNDNQLTSLNVKNGNNTAFTFFYATNNPNLTCIEVDDVNYSTSNWANNIDPSSSFSNSCGMPQTYVPDNNFEQALIDLGLDNTLDDSVTTASIDTVTILDVSGKSIADLTGIEAFTALTQLYCGFNQLTSLDVSSNTALTVLYCNYNQLDTLNVSSNTALTELYCDNNQLDTLDVSSNTALTVLYCYNNQLDTLNVSSNTALTELVCNNNQLDTLDVSSNTALQYLFCSYNQLTSLGVSGNTALKELGCSNNLLTSLDVSSNTDLTILDCYNNQLTSLDVSANTALIILQCQDNQLTSLDLRNGNNMNIYTSSSYDFNLTNNPQLYCIDVDDATYSTANWTNIDAQITFSLDCGVGGGCTDSLACNYDSTSSYNDGTCSIPNSVTTNTGVACDTYTWNGQTYTASGTYTFASTNAAGCDSTVTLALTINNSTTGTDVITACDRYTWIDGITYTASNSTAIFTSTNAAGCDNVATLDLTINSVIASISQSGDNLSAITTPIGLNANWYNIQTEDGSTRTWLMKEDAPSFKPRFDCSYFIVVEDMGCTDTSEIYAYGANAARIGSFISSPNPTSGLINVKFNNPKNQFVMLELMSSNGSKLDEFITVDNNLNIDLSKYPSGTYYLYFDSEDATQGCALEEVQKISTKIILNK